MACSEAHAVVRAATDLAIPIRPTDMLPIARCPSSEVQAGPPIVPLSLNQLKAGEIVQRMHGDANNLLCSIQGLLQYRALPATASDAGRVVPTTILGNPALFTVQRLSRDITGDMGELVALSHREARETMPGLDQVGRMRRHRRVMDRYRRVQRPEGEAGSPVQLVCHTCNARRTPQWRTGPAGPCTLCNVCGLVHAMRMRKQGRTRSKKASASSYAS